MDKHTLQTTTVRLPVELREQLEEIAKEKKITKNAVLIDAFIYYLCYRKN